MNKLSIYLMLITLIGGGLRLYQLDQRTLYGDEVASLSHSSLSLPEFIRVRLIKGDVKFLYCISLHLWRRYISNSEIGMRAYSVILGILCIPAIFSLASFLFGREVGLLSAFILAISPLHIYYSQEIRMYVHQMFFVLLSLYFFIRLLQEDKRILWIGYVVVTLSGIHMHIFSVLMLLIQNIFLFSFWRSYRRILKRWLLVQAFIVFAVPSLLIFTLDLFGRHIGFWNEYLKIGAVEGNRNIHFKLMLFPEVFSNFSIGFLVREIEGHLSILIPAVLFFASALYLSLHYLKNYPKQLVLLMLFSLLPIILTISVFSFQGAAHMFHVRHVFIASAAYYILLSIGIRSIKRVQYRAVAISALTFFSLLPLHDYYFHPQWSKIAWVHICKFINQTSQEGDAILVDNVLTNSSFRHYYKGNLPIFVISDNWPNIEEDTKRKLEGFVFGEIRYRRLWRVGLRGNTTDDVDYVTPWLEAHCKKTYLKAQDVSKNNIRVASTRLELYIL